MISQVLLVESISFVFSEDKVQEIMTPEEKQRLYDAIGYEENVDTVYPKEVCFYVYYIFHVQKYKQHEISFSSIYYYYYNSYFLVVARYVFQIVTNHD